MQWYSLPMIMMTNAVIFFTNDNDRQMSDSLPMIMTDKCSDILYQW